MNIFVLDKDIKTCAQYHHDVHIVSQTKEAVQMLSTAVRLSGIDTGYKIVHKNHPCTIWTRKSLSNWLWLRELVVELNNEFLFRRTHRKNHRSYEVAMDLPIPEIEDIGLTPFAQAMPLEYMNADPVKAYRNYYIYEKEFFIYRNKKRYNTWETRGKPEWYHQ